MAGGIWGCMDYFKIVPGSNLVIKYLDYMILTNLDVKRPCSVWVQQPSSRLSSQVRGTGSRIRPAGTTWKRLPRAHTATFLHLHSQVSFGHARSFLRKEANKVSKRLFLKGGLIVQGDFPVHRGWTLLHSIPSELWTYHPVKRPARAKLWHIHK